MSRVSGVRLVALVFLSMLISAKAQAHFIWLFPKTDGGSTRVEVYFGEEAHPDDPDLLQRLAGLKVTAVSGSGAEKLQKASIGEDGMSATFPEVEVPTLFTATRDLGVLDRGDSVFRLLYYAKGGPVSSDPAWKEVSCAESLVLDVVPTLINNRLSLQVSFEGNPAAGVQIVAARPGMENFEGTTNASGMIEFPIAESGLHSIRARFIEDRAGVVNGKAFPETRHYCTVTFPVADSISEVVGLELQPLEPMVTSFGGAVSGNRVYLYGGHTGSAHSYDNTSQEKRLRVLSLDNGRWSDLIAGPGLQGLAMVAHNGIVYRIGGFMARNQPEEEHSLWSVADVAAFDTSGHEAEWMTLPPLPEPRSSFDAAVLDGEIYVIGGWKMAGDAETEWHATAWKMDLSAEELRWTPVPAPPFRRRALSVAAHNGLLFAVGGMQDEGGPTRRTAVFSPATGKWSEGPELPGESGMAGFGSAAFAQRGSLFVSTYEGDLLRLADDGQGWLQVSRLENARFFHRMLPVGDDSLLFVGGANMSSGKFAEVEVIRVAE